MVVCELCEQAREQVYSCMKRMIGQIPFGDETHLDILVDPCQDCGVGVGGFHHPGCYNEQCPECHDLLLSCLCSSTENYRGLMGQLWWRRSSRSITGSV
jgi:hypothetical protein